MTSTAVLIPAMEALVVSFTVRTMEVVPVEILEVIAWLMVATMVRVSAAVTKAGIIVVIYRAIEAAAPVIPGTRSQKSPAIEPLWAVVPVRRAVIGRVAVIAVGAHRGRTANIDAKRHLSVSRGGNREAKTHHRSGGQESIAKRASVHCGYLCKVGTHLVPRCCFSGPVTSVPLTGETPRLSWASPPSHHFFSQRILVTAVETLVMHLAVHSVEVVAMEAAEVIRRRVVRAVGRKGAMVAITRIKVMIHRSVKAWMSVIPGTCADKTATTEPLRTVVPRGCTVVRRIAVVAIGTRGGGTTDVYADGNLGRSAGRDAEGQGERGCS